VDQDAVTSRVRIIDAGNNDRLLDLATATAKAID